MIKVALSNGYPSETMPTTSLLLLKHSTPSTTRQARLLVLEAFALSCYDKTGTVPVVKLHSFNKPCSTSISSRAELGAPLLQAKTRLRGKNVKLQYRERKTIEEALFLNFDYRRVKETLTLNSRRACAA